MADVNAAVAAALAAGADEVIVCDTHHGGGNLRLPEMLRDPRVTYHGALPPDRARTAASAGCRTWTRRSTASCCPGTTPRPAPPDAFLPHTSSLAWVDFRINGQSVGEIGLEACYAGHWDVPAGLRAGGRGRLPRGRGAVPRRRSRRPSSGPSAEPLRRAGRPQEARRLTADRVAETVARLRAGARPAPYQPRPADDGQHPHGHAPRTPTGRPCGPPCRRVDERDGRGGGGAPLRRAQVAQRHRAGLSGCAPGRLGEPAQRAARASGTSNGSPSGQVSCGT